MLKYYAPNYPTNYSTKMQGHYVAGRKPYATSDELMKTIPTHRKKEDVDFTKLRINPAFQQEKIGKRGERFKYVSSNLLYEFEPGEFEIFNLKLYNLASRAGIHQKEDGTWVLNYDITDNDNIEFLNKFDRFIFDTLIQQSTTYGDLTSNGKNSKLNPIQLINHNSVFEEADGYFHGSHYQPSLGTHMLLSNLKYFDVSDEDRKKYPTKKPSIARITQPGIMGNFVPPCPGKTYDNEWGDLSAHLKIKETTLTFRFVYDKGVVFIIKPSTVAAVVLPDGSAESDAASVAKYEEYKNDATPDELAAAEKFRLEARQRNQQAKSIQSQNTGINPNLSQGNQPFNTFQPQGGQQFNTFQPQDNQQFNTFQPQGNQQLQNTFQNPNTQQFQNNYQNQQPLVTYQPPGNQMNSGNYGQPQNFQQGGMYQSNGVVDTINPNPNPDNQPKPGRGRFASRFNQEQPAVDTPDNGDFDTSH